MTPETKAAYQYCLKIATAHYENFPVASWIMPRRMRWPIAAVYAFARKADDYADEGNMDDASRLKSLETMQQCIQNIYAGATQNEPIYIALSDTIQKFNLPADLFYDLLSAFKQDVSVTRYADFTQLMDYCKHSANPVGRLMLYLYGQTDRKSLGYSDNICSALQLINFYQDLAQDYTEMNRIYIPQNEIQAAGVNENHFQNQTTDKAMTQLMQQQYLRANKLLDAGVPLGKILKGRFGLEIRMMCAGARRILQKLSNQTDDLYSRPRLTFKDWIWVVWTALKP